MTTSDSVAQQATVLVNVSVFWTMQEAVIAVVHGFGFSRCYDKEPSSFCSFLRSFFFQTLSPQDSVSELGCQSGEIQGTNSNYGALPGCEAGEA